MVYQHMKILVEKVMQTAVMESNVSIQRSEVPDDWLHGYLRTLPKHREDPSQLSGYRVITLQNVFTDLIEKIVAMKIVIYLEAEGILPYNL